MARPETCSTKSTSQSVRWIVCPVSLITVSQADEHASRARDAQQQPLTGALAHAPRARRSVEIAWAVLPALALLFVLYLTWRAVEAPQARPAVATHLGATIGV